MSGRRNLASTEWLAARLGDPTVVIVDCRFELASVHGVSRSDAGRAAYEAGHVPGAGVS